MGDVSGSWDYCSNCVQTCHQDSDCGPDGVCGSGRCYDYRSDTLMHGSVLWGFESIVDATAYCNSHSNCKGIVDWECDGDVFGAMDGIPYSPVYNQSSCAWVRNSYSKILINMKGDMQ